MLSFLSFVNVCVNACVCACVNVCVAHLLQVVTSIKNDGRQKHVKENFWIKHSLKY